MKYQYYFSSSFKGHFSNGIKCKDALMKNNSQAMPTLSMAMEFPYSVKQTLQQL
jgi:hypothetical protein